MSESGRKFIGFYDLPPFIFCLFSPVSLPSLITLCAPLHHKGFYFWDGKNNVCIVVPKPHSTRKTTEMEMLLFTLFASPSNYNVLVELCCHAERLF